MMTVSLSIFAVLMSSSFGQIIYKLLEPAYLQFHPSVVPFFQQYELNHSPSRVLSGMRRYPLYANSFYKQPQIIPVPLYIPSFNKTFYFAPSAIALNKSYPVPPVMQVPIYTPIKNNYPSPDPLLVPAVVLDNTTNLPAIPFSTITPSTLSQTLQPGISSFPPSYTIWPLITEPPKSEANFPSYISEKPPPVMEIPIYAPADVIRYDSSKTPPVTAIPMSDTTSSISSIPSYPPPVMEIPVYAPVDAITLSAKSLPITQAPVYDSLSSKAVIYPKAPPIMEIPVYGTNGDSLSSLVSSAKPIVVREVTSYVTKSSSPISTNHPPVMEIPVYGTNGDSLSSLVPPAKTIVVREDTSYVTKSSPPISSNHPPVMEIPVYAPLNNAYFASDLSVNSPSMSTQYPLFPITNFTPATEITQPYISGMSKSYMTVSITKPPPSILVPNTNYISPKAPPVMEVPIYGVIDMVSYNTIPSSKIYSVKNLPNNETKSYMPFISKKPLLVLNNPTIRVPGVLYNTASLLKPPSVSYIPSSNSVIPTLSGYFIPPPVMEIPVYAPIEPLKPTQTPEIPNCRPKSTPVYNLSSIMTVTSITPLAYSTTIAYPTTYKNINGNKSENNELTTFSYSKSSDIFTLYPPITTAIPLPLAYSTETPIKDKNQSELSTVAYMNVSTDYPDVSKYGRSNENETYLI